MFASFTSLDSGLEVAFKTDDVKVVQKTSYAVQGQMHKGATVTLSDGTLVPLMDQYETVLNLLRTAEDQ